MIKQQEQPKKLENVRRTEILRLMNKLETILRIYEEATQIQVKDYAIKREAPKIEQTLLALKCQIVELFDAIDKKTKAAQ